jgi:hypothetical protein
LTSAEAKTLAIAELKARIKYEVVFDIIHPEDLNGDTLIKTLNTARDRGHQARINKLTKIITPPTLLTPPTLITPAVSYDKPNIGPKTLVDI